MGKGRVGRALALGILSLSACAVPARAAVLLNDSWLDGSRAENSLPSQSAVWVGVSTTDGGSFSMATGAQQHIMGSGSRRSWTYFTSDNSAPDGNQPHNAVYSLPVGWTIVGSMNFTLPNGATAASTGKDFRFGLFTDPSDARVQVDTNNDSGGASTPWSDATGYAVQFPLNSSTTNANPFTLGKRTSAASTTLIGSNNSYTNAPSGGAAFSLAANTTYTARMTLSRVSAGQLDVTASVLQGSTVLSSYTVSDLGTSFGGTNIIAGSFAAGSTIYSNFDHLFWRMSSSTEASQINITNFYVEAANVVPEPASLALVGIGLIAAVRRRRN